MICKRAPFQAMTGEPTAVQLAAAVQETACSELWRGASGDRSLGLPDRSPAQMEASVTSELEGSKETIAAPV
ncbi:MAG: hypothetical protein WB608_03840 [Terracidiphilus sp.]